MHRRVPGPFHVAAEAKRQLRPEIEITAVGDLERGRATGCGAFIAADRRLDREWIAVGRVECETGPVQAESDEAGAEGNAAEDLGQRIRDGGHLGTLAVDMKRSTDRGNAQVVGPGDRRDHGLQAERLSFVGTCEIDPAVHVERMGAGSRPCCRGADLARAGRRMRPARHGPSRWRRRAARSPPPGSREFL